LPEWTTDNEGPLRLAYEASVRAITDQSTVLEALRARAGTLFAASALVTSFLGGQALSQTQHLIVVSSAGLAVAFFVTGALMTLVILWPFRLAFSLSAGEIIKIVDERGYRVSRRRDRGVDRRVMEDVMAEKPMPKPAPQWPDVTKPDTRGGGGPPETKRRR
jgi:hypothetical protein